MEMVEILAVEDPAYVAELRELIEQHLEYTGSNVAAVVLENWETELDHFKMIIPTIYRAILDKEKQPATATRGA